MIVSIHQANYLPYPGFFHKLSMSDVFVILDDIQSTSDTNRNKIIASGGPTWLTIPIMKEFETQPIMLVKINNELPWKRLHWKKITTAYNNANFFHLYKDYFENLYKINWNYIFDLNFEIIKKIIKWLDIKIEIIRESELHVTGKSTERLVNVCKIVGADTYLSGIGGKKYLNEKLFEQNKINLQYQNYIPTTYPQHMTDSFIPNLSVIDLLANMGSKSLQIIQNQKF